MIALIGGSGFIGTRIVDNLILNKNLNFCILDINKPKKNLKFYKYCDIRNYEQLILSISDLKVDLIINLAAIHSDYVNDSYLYYDTNVNGSKNICNVAIKLGIKKIVFLSSVAVYKNIGLEINESNALIPSNDYGKSKLQAENLYLNWYQIDKSHKLIIIRPTVVFGPGNRGNLYNLIHSIYKNKFIMLGSGNNIKSICFVDNLVDFIFYTLDKNEKLIISNFADKPDYKVIELVTLIYKYLQIKRKIIFIPDNCLFTLFYIIKFFKYKNKWFFFNTLFNRMEKFTQNSIISMNNNCYKSKHKLDDSLEMFIRSDFLK